MALKPRKPSFTLNILHPFIQKKTERRINIVINFLLLYECNIRSSHISVLIFFTTKKYKCKTTNKLFVHVLCICCYWNLSLFFFNNVKMRNKHAFTNWKEASSDSNLQRQRLVWVDGRSSASAAQWMLDASSAAVPVPAGTLVMSTGRPEVVVTGGCWAPADKFPAVGTRCWSPAAWLTG